MSTDVLFSDDLGVMYFYRRAPGCSNEAGARSGMLAGFEDWPVPATARFSDPTTRVCLLKAVVPPGGVGAPGLSAFFGPAGRVVGMYLFNVDRPWVIQYMYVPPEAREWDFALAMLAYHEIYVAGRAASSDVMYMAVPDRGPTAQLCRKNSWHQVDVAQEMDTPVGDAAEPVTGAVTLVSGLGRTRLTVFPGTVVMQKAVHLGPDPSVAAAAADAGESGPNLPLFAVCVA